MRSLLTFGIFLFSFSIYALVPPHGFGLPSTITGVTTTNLLTIDYGGGKWVEAHDDTHIYYSISSNGTTWNPGTVVMGSGSTLYYSPVIRYLGIFSGQHKWLVVFIRDNGSEFDIMYSIGTDNGTSISWTSPQLVASYMSSDSADDNNPWVAVAIGTPTNVTIVWESNIQTIGSNNYGSDRDIFYVDCTYNGGSSMSCSSAAALNSDATSDSAIDEDVALATDGNGNWLAAWVRDSQDIMYSRRTGASWSAASPLVDYNSTIPAAYPQISISWRGDEVFVFWIHDIHGSDVNKSDVVYKKSTDDGANFSTVTLLYEVNNAVGIDSVRSHVGSNRWGVVFETDDNITTCSAAIGSDRDIFILLSADGNTWSNYGCLAVNSFADTDTNTDHEQFPALVSSTVNAGEWVVVWHNVTYGRLQSTKSNTVPVVLKEFLVE